MFNPATSALFLFLITYANLLPSLEMLQFHLPGNHLLALPMKSGSLYHSEVNSNAASLERPCLISNRSTHTPSFYYNTMLDFLKRTYPCLNFHIYFYIFIVLSVFLEDRLCKSQTLVGLLQGNAQNLN